MMTDVDFVLVAGNPGSGKTSLVNGFVGYAKFPSGASGGSGLTERLQWVKHNGIEYGDTPGLADQQKRQDAAQAISQALQRDGRYKLLFVLTLDAGRVRPDDVSTITLVLDALPSNMPYGIIINKVSPPLYSKLQSQTEEMDAILSMLAYNESKPDHVFLNHFEEAMHDQDNVPAPISTELAAFIASVPAKHVDTASVSPVQASEYDARQAQLNDEIQEILRQQEAARLAQAEQLRKAEERISQAQQAEKKPVKAAIVGAVVGGAALGPAGAVVGGVVASVFKRKRKLW